MADMDSSYLNSLMRPPKVCICRSVSEGDIRNAVLEQGARNFAEVQSLTGCGTGCGTCHGAVQRVIDKALADMNKKAGSPG